jgi:zinc protease
MRAFLNKTKPWIFLWLFGLLNVCSLKAALFNPKTFSLENGLKVVVIENHRAPLVTQMIWYKVGSADDPHDAKGVAHYLEHLMFKGPEGSASQEFSKILNRMGGTFNASTGPDATNYYVTVAADKLDLVMKLEAERMSSLVILDEQAIPELDVILEERKTRYETDPFGKFHESLRASWFWNHPYRHPGIGWESDIKSLTPQKAREFYKNWYGPNNAILIIAGDVTFEEVQKRAKKYFGLLPARPLLVRKREPEPSHRDIEETMILRSHDVLQPYYILALPKPIFKKDLKTSYAAQVLSYILTNGPTSLFYKTLIEEKRLASSVSFDYDGYCLDPDYALLSAQPNPGKTIAAVEEAAEKEINKILKEGISSQEVKKAKDRMLAGLAYLRDSALGGAFELGAALVIDMPLEEIENWPERIKAVTAEDVNAAMRMTFGSKRKIKGYLLAEKTDEKKHD